MKKILIPLSILFLLVGAMLINSLNTVSSPELPNLKEHKGLITKIDTYASSKFGEVVYIELAEVPTRFWLKARLEKKPKEKQDLQQTLHIGDSVTVFYTSLEGTPYASPSAPYSVHHIQKGAKTMEGLTFVTAREPNLFMKVMIYGAGGLVALVGLVIITFVIWGGIRK